MHFINKWKKNPKILLTFGILFCLISVLILQNSSLIRENQKNFEKDNLDSPTLKISDYWNNINFIHINNDNWSSTDFDWIQVRTGTWDDPHIIENVTINGGGSGSCIIIENSKEFFIIRNCTVYNSGSLENQETLQFDAGIKLINTFNGLILNNSCSDTIMAIYLQESNNITISRNNANNNTYGIFSLFSVNTTILKNKVYNNVYGIDLVGCNNNTLVGNILSNNTQGIVENVCTNIIIKNNTINPNCGIGLFIMNSNNNTISGNNMTECGMAMLGEQAEFSSNVVDDSNLVNGNSLYYYINEIGLGKDNFTNPGQIILINCSDSLISNLSISHATCGILLYYCENNTIQNNNISYCRALGIGLWSCSNLTISNNSMVYCGFYIAGGEAGAIYSYKFSLNLVNGKAVYYYVNETGLGKDDFTNPGQIMLLNCSDSVISDLNISHATVGIGIGFGKNITISNVTISHNLYGLVMGLCYNSTISECALIDNTNSGIYFGANYNTIINNTINGNGIGIEILNDCQDNVFTENIIKNNNRGVVMGNMYGICENNTFSGNSIKRNKNDGIFLQNCKNNTFSGNILSANGWRGIVCKENCYNNLFYGNYLLGNGINVVDDPLNNNYWNGSDVGNFWDDYAGLDADNDGIGDTPHYFMEGVDYLPIWESLAPIIIINLPSDGATFGSTSPNFEVIIKDETIVLLEDIIQIDTMWYTLDGGKTNYAFVTNGTIDQAAWDTLPEGLIILRFYANDTLGNLGTSFITVVKSILSISATIDVDPNTLNLKSRVKWLTVYIELPIEFDVNDIDISSILLNEQVSAKKNLFKVGDYDNDGIPDLMVKFSKKDVQSILEPGENVEIVITGLINDLIFEGRDYIRVISKGK